MSGTPARGYVPRLLCDIAEAFGEPAAIRLAMEFGGQRLRIPRRAHPSHVVARHCGMAMLRWLSERYGGEYLTVPTGARSARAEQAALVRRLVEEGRTVRAIVIAARVHSRTVHRARERQRAETQDDLFGGRKGCDD